MGVSETTFYVLKKRHGNLLSAVSIFLEALECRASVLLPAPGPFARRSPSHRGSSRRRH
jgi:hypothetical protein